MEVTPSGEDYEAYDSGLDMERLQDIWEEEQQQMEEVLPSTAPQVTETQPEKNGYGNIFCSSAVFPGRSAGGFCDPLSSLSSGHSVHLQRNAEGR